MTYRANRINLNQQCVIVTIGFDRNHIQEITALLSFGPETILGTAEKSYFPGLYCLVISFLIHKTKHQHLTSVIVLYDSGNKPIHFIKIQHFIYNLFPTVMTIIYFLTHRYVNDLRFTIEITSPFSPLNSPFLQ